jgi:DNA-binding NarL/FixJ family response regulator
MAPAQDRATEKARAARDATAVEKPSISERFVLTSRQHEVLRLFTQIDRISIAERLKMPVSSVNDRIRSGLRRMNWMSETHFLKNYRTKTAAFDAAVEVTTRRFFATAARSAEAPVSAPEIIGAASQPKPPTAMQAIALKMLLLGYDKKTIAGELHLREQAVDARIRGGLMRMGLSEAEFLKR